MPLLEKYNPGDLEMIHAIYLGGGDVPTRGADALSAASPLAFVPKHGFSVLPASLVKPNVRIAVAEGVAAVTPVAIRRHGGSTQGNARH